MLSSPLGHAETKPVAPAPDVAVYFDYATAAPLRPAVRAGLKELLDLPQVDPSRPFDDALVIRDLIEQARNSIAHLAGVEARSVTFMSSIAEAALTAYSSLEARSVPIITSAAERLSLLEHAAAISTVHQVQLDEQGRIDLDHLAATAGQFRGSIIVAQHANQEIGVINDIEAIFDIAEETDASVICDETLTFGRSIERPKRSAFRIVSAELLGGPLGSVALIHQGDLRVKAQLLGGAQERGRRSGLENHLGIIGFGLAADCLADLQQREVEDQSARRFCQSIDQMLLASGLGHRLASQQVPTLGYLSSYVTPGFEASAVAMALNRSGVAVHAGSACSGEDPLPSATHQALGYDGLHSLRISVGWATTDHDVSVLGTALDAVALSLGSLKTH